VNEHGEPIGGGQEGDVGPLHHIAPPHAAEGRLRLTRDELVAWGEAFGRAARPPLYVAIAGELGAGKTTLVQAICRGYGVTEPVTSPTFALVHEYSAPRSSVFHLDLFRLKEHRELAGLGWEDILAAEAVALIEWPERAAELLPSDHVGIELQHVPNDEAHRLLLAG
jgi:tRNA threonylcarbamoyladenosine biosynthesis protein TsaE